MILVYMQAGLPEERAGHFLQEEKDSFVAYQNRIAVACKEREENEERARGGRGKRNKEKKGEENIGARGTS